VVTPSDWDSPATLSEAAFTRRHLKRFRPQAVIFNYSWLTSITQHIPKSISAKKNLLLAYDVRHLECMLSEQGIDFKERSNYSRAREVAELKLVDTIIAIQSREAACFRQLVPEKNVLVTTAPHEFVALSSLARQPGRCLLVGSNHSANEEGARWFLESAWPIIRAEIPTAELHVCGNLCEAPLFTNPLPGVTLRGRVENLKNEYASATVVVAPVLFGSGLKIKVAEALSHGVAVVGTAIAFDGIDPRPPILAARNTPEEFAGQAIRLLSDRSLRNDAEHAARELAQKNFCPEAALASLISELRTLIS
jgi:succinoglycan biosynthesis protein ExoO